MSGTLTLYTRIGCGLCEEMEAALPPWQRRLGFEVETVDVDSEEVLARDYGDKVPLLADGDGREICRYFFDESALQAYFASSGSLL